MSLQGQVYTPHYPYLFLMKKTPLVIMLYQEGNIWHNFDSKANLISRYPREPDIYRFAFTTEPQKDRYLGDWLCNITDCLLYIYQLINTANYSDSSFESERAVLIFSNYSPLSYLVVYTYTLIKYRGNLHITDKFMQENYGYQSILFNKYIMNYIIPRIHNFIHDGFV